MISVKVGKKKYKVPNSFDDVSAKQLHTLKDLKPKTVIEHFTKIPKIVIDKLSADNILALFSLLSFVEEEPIETHFIKQIDVGAETWFNLEMAKQAMQTNNAPFIAVELSRIYFGEDVFDWPVSLIYGQTAQILNSLSVFLNRYKELNEDSEYDSDQLEAGVKGLETFGVGAIRYSLAKGDVTKYEAIEKMSAEAVYFTLLFEKAKNEYSERLIEIKKRSQNTGK